jgi:hypothetical protein
MNSAKNLGLAFAGLLVTLHCAGCAVQTSTAEDEARSSDELKIEATPSAEVPITIAHKSESNVQTPPSDNSGNDPTFLTNGAAEAISPEKPDPSPWISNVGVTTTNPGAASGAIVIDGADRAPRVWYDINK